MTTAPSTNSKNQHMRSAPLTLLGHNGSMVSVMEYLNLTVSPFSLPFLAVMLIVMATLVFALAFVNKYAGNNNALQQISQRLSEKLGLYMAGSMVGEYTKRIFNAWTTSRQESISTTNRDEKSKRISIEGSSSSTSFSSSTLPIHNTTQKKDPATQLSASHRRQNSRLKPQVQDIDFDPILTINNTSSMPPIDCYSSGDNPSVGHDDGKATFTIDVAEPGHAEVEKDVSENNDNNDADGRYNDSVCEDHSNIQTPSLNPTERLQIDANTRDTSVTDEKASIQTSITAHSDNNYASTDYSMITQHQETDGEVESIISDDHSESNSIRSVSVQSSLESKSSPRLTQDASAKRRRRRRTRGKGNKQRAHHGQQHPDNQKQETQIAQSIKHDTGQQLIDKRLSAGYQSTDINMSSSRRHTTFRRSPDPLWKPSVPSPSHNPIGTSASQSSIRYPSYADVISPNSDRTNLPITLFNGMTGASPEMTTTDPTKHKSNTSSSSQWYSPFQSGLSIQLTPPASPPEAHKQLPGTGKCESVPTFSFFSGLSGTSSASGKDKYRTDVHLSQYAHSGNGYDSILSNTLNTFTPFANNVFAQPSPINHYDTSAINQSFTGSFFKRRMPLVDQEKGEYSGEDDDNLLWNPGKGIHAGVMDERTWKKGSTRWDAKPDEGFIKPRERSRRGKEKQWQGRHNHGGDKHQSGISERRSSNDQQRPKQQLFQRSHLREPNSFSLFEDKNR